MNKFDVTLKMSDGEIISFVIERSDYDSLVLEFTEGNSGWIENGDEFINMRYVRSFEIKPHVEKSFADIEKIKGRARLN
ncbi:hypothetical protein PAT3040_04144 [Paenibacillus agaridevorans]|uniref:Uncharacterized protein n=1 Tax=Paenibacillus agaridevorans TaxID=171404 RepID=A0A2R5ESF3_9BACL|nr:hypothetical protein [Paenibacillus agaridevorans]GBG09497.1 hypothetical protein PAT3040_04144 [Paenibacillus agaridevorans]